MNLQDFMTSRDWASAAYLSAAEPVRGRNWASSPDWRVAEVEAVLAVSEGQPSETRDTNWLALVRLRDGRHVFLSAGHAGGGWSGGWGLSMVAGSLENAILSAGPVDRERLGFSAQGSRP